MLINLMMVIKIIRYLVFCYGCSIWMEVFVGFVCCLLKHKNDLLEVIRDFARMLSDKVSERGGHKFPSRTQILKSSRGDSYPDSWGSNS